jgi:hypothetical protein
VVPFLVLLLLGQGRPVLLLLLALLFPLRLVLLHGLFLLPLLLQGLLLFLLLALLLLLLLLPVRAHDLAPSPDGLPEPRDRRRCRRKLQTISALTERPLARAAARRSWYRSRGSRSR